MDVDTPGTGSTSTEQDAARTDDAVVVPEAESPSPSSRWSLDNLRPSLKGLIAFVAYLVVSIIYWGRPVVAHMSTMYVGMGKGDSNIYVWSLTWTQWAIQHGHNPFFTNQVYAPGGTDLTWVTFLPGPGVLLWPITHAFGALASYNLAMLLAPALLGWATYLVCHRVTRRFWPSLVGGYLVGFSAYMVGQMHGHMNLVLLFPAPLAIYLVIRRVEGSLGWITFVLSLFATLVGMFMISTELFATMTLFGAIAFGLALIFGGSARRAIFRTGLLVGATYLGVVIALLPVLISTLHHAPSGAIRDAADRGSIDLLSFVIPRWTMALGGSLRTITDNWTARYEEDGGYLTIPLIVMLVWYAISERRSKVTWGLLSFIAIVGVLSLGPLFHLDGREEVTNPAGSLIASAPLLEHATPQRFPGYLAIAVGIVAAIWLAKASGRWAWTRWVVVLLGAVLLFPAVDSPPFHPTQSLEPFFSQQMYRNAIAPGEVVLPIAATKGEEMQWQAASNFWFRMSDGYIGTVPGPYQGNPIARGLARHRPHNFVPSLTNVLSWVYAHQVTAVVVADQANEMFGPVLEQAGLKPTQHLGGVTIWRRTSP